MLRCISANDEITKYHGDSPSFVMYLSKGIVHLLSCLRKLLKIMWQDKIPDTEVLKKAGMQSMHTVLKLAQLRWADHVVRMPDERLPKKVFYVELQ